MSFADKLTWLRIILSPVFFIIFFLPVWFPQISGLAALTVPILWTVAIIAEITDLFDGMAARKLKEVSDYGKIFDPFADTIMQITAFLCFVMLGIFPAILYLLVIYREFGILFIRNLMQRKNITMGARMSGKVKTVTYITAGTIALIYVSLDRLDALVEFQKYVRLTSVVIFYISVVFSVISFFDYLNVYRKASKAESKDS